MHQHSTHAAPQFYNGIDRRSQPRPFCLLPNDPADERFKDRRSTMLPNKTAEQPIEGIDELNSDDFEFYTY